MKTFQLSLNELQERELFDPIYSKLDYARFFLLSSRYMLMNISSNSKSFLSLKIDKSKRLYCYSENKFFSVAYPCSIDIDNNHIVQLRTINGIDLNYYSISSALSILKDEIFINNPSLTNFYLSYNPTADLLLENTVNVELGISLLEEVFQYEPSYIRYDYDEKNKNGNLHPLNHFDICYSSEGTFKIGIDDKIDFDFFKNILDINTDCIFVK